MLIQTESGMVSGSIRSPYMKWLQGWKAGDGFTGATTLSAAWQEAQSLKLQGCSWYSLGFVMAKSQAKGRELEAASWA